MAACDEENLLLPDKQAPCQAPWPLRVKLLAALLVVAWDHRVRD